MMPGTEGRESQQLQILNQPIKIHGQLPRYVRIKL
jgi:hypothetical protein